MKLISDERLAMVTGGTGAGRKTILLCIPMPLGTRDDLNIRVYVNGVLDRSQSSTVSCGTRSVRLAITGNGPAEIVVKINSSFARTYHINFETQGYTNSACYRS